jgi:hypothetical protein
MGQLTVHERIGQQWKRTHAHAHTPASTLHKLHKQSLDFIGQNQANEATSGPTVHRAIVNIVAGGTASASTACPLPSVIPHKGHQPVANELNLNSIFKNKHRDRSTVRSKRKDQATRDACARTQPRKPTHHLPPLHHEWRARGVGGCALENRGWARRVCEQGN